MAVVRVNSGKCAGGLKRLNLNLVAEHSSVMTKHSSNTWGMSAKGRHELIDCSRDISEIYRKYIGNISEIYRKYIGNISEIYRKYIGNISEIYRKYIRPNAVAQLVEAQAGRSRVRFPMVSLEFLIDVILPAALWFWDRLGL
jgi:hypothetical protein